MISNRQMKRTLMIELFSTTGLFLSAMAQNLKQLSLGMLAAALYAVYFLCIGNHYQISQVGRIRKTVYTVRFFLYACFLGTLMKLLVSKMLLGGGSGWFIFLPVFLLSIYANRGGREERARLLELLFWFVFLPLFGVLTLAAKDVHLEYLIQGGFHAEKSIQVFVCFSSLEILLFFTGERREKVKALFFVFGLNLLIFIVTIGMYGAKMAEASDLPVVTMIQMVRFPGGFVERLDIFMLAFWILSLFAIFSAYCFYGTFFWGKGKGSFWLSCLFYGGVLAIVSWNQLDLQTLIDFFQTYVLWLDLPLAVILPLLNTKRRKRAVVVTMLSALLFIVTGCGPKRVNIEERAYVLAIGVEAKEERWKVSFFLPENERIETEGKSWEEIKKEFQRSSDKELELGHLKAVILGKEVEAEDFKEQWKNEQDYAKTVLLFTTQEPIKEFEKIDENTRDSLGSFLVELAERNKKEITIGDYFAGRGKIPDLSIRKGIPTL